MRERMVHSHQTAFLLAPFKHREVDHPEASEFVFVAESELTTHLKAQLAELFARLHSVVAAEDEDEVARLCVESLRHFLKHLLRVEFVDA